MIKKREFRLGLSSRCDLRGHLIGAASVNGRMLQHQCMFIGLLVGNDILLDLRKEQGIQIKGMRFNVGIEKSIILFSGFCCS